YALMQLIAETYSVLAKGLHLDDNAIHAVFKKWNQGRLKSYLIEITRDIFTFKNPGDDHLLLNAIKDEAKAKGTGKWTSQAAMDLGVPVPLIDISVAMRDLSKFKSLRTEASKIFPEPAQAEFDANTDAYLSTLEQAFYFSMVTAFAQGMHLLYKASREYEYGLNLALIAKIWRGGCIIRAAFLENIYKAFNNDPKLQHIFLDKSIGESLAKSANGIRTVVSDAASQGISVPAFSAALSYFDAFRSENMPSNLIQAQRDYFGSHTYELRGKEGIFHTQWTVNKQ
ncbi:MAG: NADP-dependent phosphogluconate dehydrogenase, partial [Bacteroidales bacterium]|nr:NADP-dependent phosphogluconate dehydrogenase [Bacteroidales bacterium]